METANHRSSKLSYFYSLKTAIMKRILPFLLLLSALISCHNTDYPKADNALVCAQDFLDACMKGDFKQANFYMLKDTTNISQLKQLKQAYYKNTADQREEYRNANIVISNDEVVTPGTEIITYKNSYDQITRKLRVINQSGTWLVDVKYTFSGNL